MATSATVFAPFWILISLFGGTTLPLGIPPMQEDPALCAGRT